jgi:response regulator NasT
MSLRVLLVDARRMGGSRLSSVLEASGFRVVAVVTDGDDMVEAVKRHLPDAILIDADSPRRDTLEGLALLNQRFPRPAVLLSEQDDQRLAHAALEAGVSTYTVSDASPALVRSLVEVSVSHFRAHGRLQAELARMQDSLEESRIVDRAKCLLMERQALSEREAYARLRRLAMDRRQKLADVAQSLLNQAIG